MRWEARWRLAGSGCSMSFTSSRSLLSATSAGVRGQAPPGRSGLRRMWLQLEVPALLVVMRTDPQLCRAAQAGREFPVPTAVVSRYCRELEVALRREIPVERWDEVVIVKR